MSVLFSGSARGRNFFRNECYTGGSWGPTKPVVVIVMSAVSQWQHRAWAVTLHPSINAEHNAESDWKSNKVNQLQWRLFNTPYRCKYRPTTRRGKAGNSPFLDICMHQIIVYRFGLVSESHLFGYSSRSSYIFGRNVAIFQHVSTQSGCSLHNVFQVCGIISL